MPATLTAKPIDLDATRSLLDQVVALVGAGGDQGDGFVELRIGGEYRPSPAPPARQGLRRDLAAAAGRLDLALRRLRSRGGTLACVTEGTAGGAIGPG